MNREPGDLYMVGPKHPGGIMWSDGQMAVWDDSPAEDFGQMWITACIRCGNGPLDANGLMVCSECDPRPLDTSMPAINTAVARAAWISGGRQPF